MAYSIFAVAAAAAMQAVAPQASTPSVPVTATIAPPVRAVILAPPAGSVLRAGTEVPLRVEEGLNSNDKTLREGQQFRLSVANPVMLGNVVVIPAGSQAIGEITDLRRKGMWGKSGHVNARVLNVRVGDRLIRLTGTFDEHGTTGTAGVVGSILLVPIAGFFMTGTSAKIPVGSGVKAFLDEDLAIAVPQAEPVPLAQPAATASVPVQPVVVPGAAQPK
ncbi:MAG: hypothetical protein V4513_08800 [Pseudomonadota bacterium]